MKRPIAATVSHDFLAGYRVAPHAYRHDQLVHALAGTLEVHIGAQMWLVTPQRGLWIPSCVTHSLHFRSNVRLCRILIDSSACQAVFPTVPRAVVVSSLLRELILRAATSGAVCSDERRAELILTLIPEEITWATESPLLLPEDARLRRICMAILENPADRRGLTQWATYGALSSRTLARLFHTQLGMSYQYWRQLALATSALPRLHAGESVTKVALDLGYETPGAFSAMFRRIMRTCPSQYRTDPRANRSGLPGPQSLLDC